MKSSASRPQSLRWLAALTFFVAAASLCATSALAAPVKVKHGILVGKNGMTLYTFGKDKPGKSVCYGKCAVNWPPLFAAAGAKASGHYGIIHRKGGKRQWTYKDKPLYFFKKDKKPGDETGNGVIHLWHVVRL